MNVADRINRILLIMSYVSQNQGIWLDDLAQWRCVRRTC